jgi:tetratricopeptide (TPR) repeat protein
MRLLSRLFIAFTIAGLPTVLISIRAQAGGMSFPEALAEAKHLEETDPGKAYDVEFSKVVAPRLSDVVSKCTKDSGPRINFEVVLVFAANGQVEQVLTAPDQPAAACVGAKLRDLRLPAPPRPGWPVQLSVNISPDNVPARSKQTSVKRGAGASAESDDMKLAMKAAQAEAAKNYDEALKLYENAIKLHGHFTPFVYQNRGMLYLHRAKASSDRNSRIADLQRAIADFNESIALGAKSDDELNHGLEKVATRANLEEATGLLARETHR